MQAESIGSVRSVPNTALITPVGRAARRTLAFVSRASVMGGSWFVVVFFAVLWTWGTAPHAFPSPDEAVNRLAASLIGDTGRPFLDLRFADNEDLAHPRFWVSLEGHAVPAYPPVALYIYAVLSNVPLIGFALIAALPASAAATFALATRRLLPRGREWAAYIAPLLGFPAAYWLMRPWINISMLLVCLCWAFYCWTGWHTSRDRKMLSRTFIFVGLAAAIRPDYAPYVLAAAMCFVIAGAPEQWRRIAAFAVLAGVGAVVVNLALNWVITGDPFRAAYQIHSDRLEDAASAPSSGPLAFLVDFMLPWGIPAPSEAWTFVLRYWVRMGAISILLAGQLLLIPLMIAMPKPKRLWFAAGLAVLVVFMISRMSMTLYGADESAGLVRHSIPRYWSPIYLFAALPPLVFAARARNDMLVGIVATLAVLLAGSGAYDIYTRQPESMTYLRDLRGRNADAIDTLAADVPEDSMVYTRTQDKVFWSRWHVGLIREPKATALSIKRATHAFPQVFLAQPGLTTPQWVLLVAELEARGLTLSEVDTDRGLYRVVEGGISLTP